MASGNDLLLTLTTVGGLGIAAFLLLPPILKKINGEQEEEEETIDETVTDAMEEPETGRITRRVIYRKKPTSVVNLNELIDRNFGEKQYLITDKDFDYLDINKKERRTLNKYHKLIVPQDDRIIYGDRGDRPLVIPQYYSQGYYVNSITPSGLVPNTEFTRLPNENQTNLNTRKNTISLY